MSLTRSLAMLRHELRVLSKDLAPVVVLTAMPIAVIAFLKPTLRPALNFSGYPEANGAEQAVPGMAVMFAFFLVGFTGFAFFREHGWATWDRLRASPARTGEIVFGKIVPGMVVATVQLVVLFGLGVLLFGMRVPGSALGLGLVAFCLALFLAVFAVALVSLCRTVQQLNAVANIGAMLFAGLGGALTPVTFLPGWAQPLAPATPSYWAMRGFRSVVLDGTGLAGVVLPVIVLLAFTAGAGLIIALRFRVEESKVSWA